MSHRALSGQFKDHLGTIALGVTGLGIAAGFAGNAVVNDRAEQIHNQWAPENHQEFQRPYPDLRGE